MRESERGKRDQNISFPRSKVRKHYQQNLLLLLEKKTPVFNSPFQIPDSRPKENEKISPLCSLSLSLPFHPRARSRCASSRRRRGWQRRDATATRRKKRCIPRAHVALALQKKRIKREKTKTHLDRRRRGLHVQRAVQIHARRFLLLLLHATGRHGVVFFSFSLTRARDQEEKQFFFETFLKGSVIFFLFFFSLFLGFRFQV